MLEAGSSSSDIKSMTIGDRLGGPQDDIVTKAIKRQRKTKYDGFEMILKEIEEK